MYKKLKILTSKSNKSLRVQLENKSRICLNINKSSFIKSETTEFKAKIISLYNNNTISYKTYRYLLNRSYPLNYFNIIEEDSYKLFTEWAVEGGIYTKKSFHIKV